MADFSKLIITDKGKELLNSEMLLEGPLEFTKISISSREYGEEIGSLEELADVKQEEPVRKVTVEHGAVVVDFMLTNEELEEGYFIRSIGLFARQRDGEEILFAASVEKSGGSYMPEHSETVTSLQMKLTFRIDNVQNVKIVVDAGGTATMGDVLEVRDMVLEEAGRAETAEEQLKKQTEIEAERASKKEAELEEKKLDKDGDASDTVINFLPAKQLEPLQSGGEQRELFGQLEKAVAELISHLADKANPHDTAKEQVGLGNVDNTADMDKPVSAAQQVALDELYAQLTSYTLQKIADLINGAPSTLDTLGEIAQAMKENENLVAALDAAVGKKANSAEFDSHVKDTTVHITAAERNNWNSKADGNHTHNYAASGHTHDDRYYTEAEVDSKLSGKADSSHTHNYAASGHTHDDRYYTESEVDSKLGGKADSNHTHNYAASGHTHDDRYYTESEIDSKLSGKADSSHNHNGTNPVFTSVEIKNSTPFIDFHYGNSSADYTSRIIENAPGTLEISGDLQLDGTLKKGNTPVFRLEGSTLYITF